MVKIEQHLLHLAGEYRVCSELNKRGVFATMTYGNHKSVDVYAIHGPSKRATRIEVKTSQDSKFVTSITQKHLADALDAPEFWVLFQLQQPTSGAFTERFFVLTHSEICAVQSVVNESYAKRHREKHGTEPDFLSGVDNVTVEVVKQFEGQWAKITDRLAAPVAP